MMKSHQPRDDLLARYNEAKAQWPDGLPSQPSASTRERIMRAAREQVDATNSVAPRAYSATANGLNSIENAQAGQMPSQQAANDSFWNIRALGSLAVMGLAGLLWWQFEQGTPEERAQAQSAKPSSTIAAATPAPASAPIAAPAAAPASAAAAMPAAAAESIAPPAANATAKLAQAKTAPQSSSKEIAERATQLPVPVQASEPTPAPSAAPASALEAARARDAEANASIAPSSRAAAAASQTPLPPPPRPAAAPAPMAKSAPHAEKATTDSSTSGIQYAAPAASSPAAAANAPRVMASPAPAARALIASPDKLFQAIEAKDAAALRQALSQGAAPNANASLRSPEGHPALTQAVIQRWQEGVRILLAFGADRNAKNNKGHTAADVALELGLSEISELLAAPK